MEKEELLRLHLEVAVPLLMHEYRLVGGPSEQDYARARNMYPTKLGAQGDALLFRDKRTAEVIDVLADGMAILAFCPGGVSALGLHFEAEGTEEKESQCLESDFESCAKHGV